MTTLAPLLPTLSASNGVIDTSSPSSSASSSIYILLTIVAVVLVVVVVLVCGGILMLVFIVKKHQVGHADVKDEMSMEIRRGQSQVRPGESHGSFNFAEGR